MSPLLGSEVEGAGARATQLNFLIIGAGSRGSSYAHAVTVATPGTVTGIAEPHDFKRKEFGQTYIWGNSRKSKEGEEFKGWREYIEWETSRRSGGQKSDITGIFICTLDHTHAEIIHALAPLNLHVMCEKPLALSLNDCIRISRSLQPDGPPSKIFSIGHVLRYSPHNRLLRKLVLHDHAIGEVVSVEHTEPVGWWHFSHSYVRGNWRRSTPEGVGTLLTKSCHDIDFIMWMLSSPVDAASDVQPHIPSTITSTGHLTHFRKARKPKTAGNATNCLSCAIADKDAKEGGCNYSALKIYRDRWLREKRYTGWPLKIVVPEIEDIVNSAPTPEQGWNKAEHALQARLADDYDKDMPDTQIADRAWYGRCVYEADNDVMDDQTVVVRWEEESSKGPKTAVFHMTYPTKAQCDRRGRVYGTEGEIWYDSKSISVYTFADENIVTHTLPKQSPAEEKAHGGGDWGLTRAFVNAVFAAESGESGVREAQLKYIGADIDEIIRSHAVVFAAEEARQKSQVVNFPEWWAEKTVVHPNGSNGYH